ncbi:MFS transporter [Pseudonocardia kunmingensis]|uniref:Sugar phosphate permease n=1 Tax=Pseudonocardia kunmingensis TaxID=630975 RepID=A0A543DQJ2_9PSEU|nr:MFS transporter [Pseudonocardia kunmingensis]TQM11583.1 sugar phosphate permease [Pseudonocardia kunmingensis]
MAGTDSAQSARRIEATPQEMRRILASSFVGTAIEYYDFILYATAASVVFGTVFFTGVGPGVAQILAFGTLAAGYFARPLGGIVFGHLGDRLGRKSMLVVTLVLMGLVSTLIGLLPTTEQIGVAAPLLLVLLRILQGVAVGGEWGGAMLLGFERAKKESRGFAASFAYMGAPAGTIVGTLALSLASTLPREDFLSWGWRVPFLFSAVLAGVGLVIRLKTAESAVFQEAVEAVEEKQVPVGEVLTRYPRRLLLAIAAGISGQAAQGLMGVWALGYAVTQLQLSPTSVLNVKALTGVCVIAVVVVAARLSDRIGRRPVMMGGNVAALLLAFPIMFLLDAGSVWAVFLALLLGLAVIQGFVAGPYGAFAAELFPTRIRYTGTSMGYQIAAALGAGLMPVIASSLVLVGGGSLWLVALAWMGMTSIGLVALVVAKEGKDHDLRDIG